MKPFSLFIALVAFANICLAQNAVYQFAPKWKVGDKRHLTIAEVKESTAAVEHERNDIEADVEVTKEDKDYYYVTLKYDNVVLTAVKKFYQNLGEEANAYKKLNLKYKVNKKTGAFELLNWKEAQDFITTSIEQIGKLVKKKAPDVAPMINTVFDPIKNLFKDKAAIEAYFSGELGYLSQPFDKKLSIGDTTRITQKVPNPFMANDSIQGTTLTFLKSLNSDKTLAEIGTKELMDLGTFKKMMIDMIRAMAKNTGAEADDSKLEELNKMEFDMDISSSMQYNINTTWLVGYKQTTLVKINDGTKSNTSTVTKTVTIN